VFIVSWASVEERTAELACKFGMVVSIGDFLAQHMVGTPWTQGNRRSYYLVSSLIHTYPAYGVKLVGSSGDGYTILPKYGELITTNHFIGSKLQWREIVLGDVQLLDALKVA